MSLSLRSSLGVHASRTLRSPFTRPRDVERSPRRLLIFWFICFFCTNRQATPTAPFRRVNGIVVEGVERHGCRESRDGQGMALRGVPLKRRWSERTRSEAQGRMQGKTFWLLLWRLTKVTRPAGRNHSVSEVAWEKKGDRFIFLPQIARISGTLSSAPPTGFAFQGESLSLVWPRESNQIEGHPNIRVWPAARLPSFGALRGLAYGAS